MAEAFSAAGARVWISDLDEGALADCPVPWQKTRADVSDAADMAALFAGAEAEWGGLDVLCANAGIAGPTALVEDVDPADWRHCVSVNLDGAFLAAKYAAPMMKRQGAGAILLTTSTAGFFGYPQRSPYAAAKWAVIGLTKSVAAEVGPYNIRCNAICPGAVSGPRMDRVIAAEAGAASRSEAEVRKDYASGSSLRRFVEPEEIADMAVFLGSPASKMVSGQAISVDGHTETYHSE